ncbi:hypothetical protein [Spartinivicinus ruber]|uniref:hypothetical protein n=1 Tax=Spartinivicinus ruber TaxID=2683272 RepID=UPI0013D6B486|nr:hypothetical protein [Spartinivicinus ruber]
MKFISTIVALAAFSASYVTAGTSTETRCPDIASIQYDGEFYESVLPGTSLVVKSHPGENVGVIESFDSAFLDRTNKIFVHCVYRLGNDDPVVLWPVGPVQAEKNDSNSWAPFLNYDYCIENSSVCRFNVQP